MYYHFPDCYAKQGMDYLNRNPYVPYISGRKSSLAPDDRRKRFLLVRRFNALVQRRNKDNGFPDKELTSAIITNQMIDLAMEMIPLGGVPQSWMAKIGG